MSKLVTPIGVGGPAMVETVSVEAASFAPGVTTGGENEQLAPAGSPAHENVTGLLNVLTGLTVTKYVAFSPRGVLTDGGVTPTE
jgi:hypothetical protein